MKLQNEKARVVFQKQTFSKNSKDRLMESLKRNIQALEEENRKLRNEKALLLGKLAQKQNV
jgi:cell division protein FtsB